MKSRKTIKLAASDAEKIIKDLSLLIVSMDRLGSTYNDDAKQRAVEMVKFFSKVNAFKILAQTRAIVSEAYELESAKADVLRLEETAENLPYWKPKQQR